MNITLKKNLILICIMLSLTESSGQCTTGVNGSGTNQNELYKKYRQSFQVSCTGKLNTIVFNPSYANCDDLRNQNIFVGVRLLNASNVVLANGTVSGSTFTDQWYNNATISFNFSASNITLFANTEYRWELYITGDEYELSLLTRTSSDTYPNGSATGDGIVKVGEFAQWSVNVDPPACTNPTVTATTPASKCGRGNVTLYATPSAGTIQWFTTATGGTALTNGAQYTISGNNITLNDLATTTTLHTQAVNGTCVSASRTAVNATITNCTVLWTGAINNAWSNSGNWSNNLVPNGTLDIEIPMGNPVLDVSYTVPTSKTVTVSGTGTLTIAPNASLTVQGQVHFNGRPVTIKSDATGSATIGQVTGTLSGATNVTVERYIPLGKRAFRFLTPGVTTDNFISNNWQLGTHITGSTTGANGFDATLTGNPSLFTYNNQVSSGTGWTPIASTTGTNLNAGQGYRILINGDRSISINGASLSNMNNPITLSATGTVLTGDVVFNSSSTLVVNNTNNTTTNGYSLVGNPYVNTLNWNTLSKSGLTDTYYTWDANMGTAGQRGRYVAFSSSTGTNNITSAVNQFIQPGQAFFIKNSILGTAGTLTFHETDKTGSANINNFYRTVNNLLTRLDLQVYETTELALGTYPIDAAVTVFDNQFTNAIETGDVAKLSTGIENISFLNSATNLTIDARSQVAVTDELLVQLQQFQASKSYTFRTHFNNFDAATTPFLVDTYLNHYTALTNNASTDVVFTTTTDAASYDTNRFKIVFQNTALGNPDFFAERITLYPNPVTNGQFFIALPNSVTGNVTIKIINLIGQTVYQTTTLAQNNISIKTDKSLPKAVYAVQIENQGKTITKKITVK